MFTRQMSKPLVLITNDDGVLAPGIRAVAEALRDFAEVVVAAPDRERSAASHSISLDRPLRVDEIEPGIYAIDGTPVDCVYLALLHLVPRKPALVVSGINNGFNLGSDVFYSGTVAGAVEAALRGVPALAVSLERKRPQDFSHAAAFARALAHEIIRRGADALPARSLLSVNLPPGPVRGFSAGASPAIRSTSARICAGGPTTGSAGPKRTRPICPAPTAAPCATGSRR